MWSYKNSSIKIWRVAFMSIDLTEASCERHYFIQICQSWNNELVHRDQCCERVCVVCPSTGLFWLQTQKDQQTLDEESRSVCERTDTAPVWQEVREKHSTLSRINKDVTAAQSWIIWYKHVFFRLSVRCLVHAVKSSAVSYSKIRASSARCQFDVCRHELSFGCKRKDGCCFAHSLVELQIWTLQRDTGTQTHALHLHSLHASHIQKENISTKKLHKHDI